MTPHWLTAAARVSLGLSALSALILAGDMLAGRKQKTMALSENPTAPRFFAAKRNETNSVFVAAMSSRRIFAKRLNGGSR